MAFVAARPTTADLPRLVATTGGRGAIDDLPNPRPIGEQLPAVFQDDEFCQRLMTAFDEGLAPVFATLDCLDSYLDPSLAPPDFVDWLAGWVGVEIDETWTLERRRRLIADAAVLYRIRGTAAGLAAHVRLYAGVTPEIEENGACTWSQTADGPLPGSPQPRLTVRLRVDDVDEVRRTTVNRIVAGSRPAHLPYELEIVVAGSAVQAPDDGSAAAPSGAPSAAPGAVDLPGSERIELAPHRPVPADGPEGPEATGGPEPVNRTDAVGGSDVAGGPNAVGSSDVAGGPGTPGSPEAPAAGPEEPDGDDAPT